MSATTSGRALPGIYHKAGSLRAERRWALWTAYISLIFAAIIMLAPPVYMFLTSIKTSAEIADLSGTPWWVRNPTLENYRALITNPMFMGFMWNSVKVTVLVVALSMVISVLAAFALARMRFWGSQWLATGVFLTYLVPDTLLFIPLYQIVGGLGLLNSTWMPLAWSCCWTTICCELPCGGLGWPTSWREIEMRTGTPRAAVRSSASISGVKSLSMR